MTPAREAAEAVLCLREEENASPEDIMAMVRRDYPEASLTAVFRELSAMTEIAGNA